MSRRVEQAMGLAFALVLSPAMLSSAAAQSNLDAGKSPAQIFSDTCNACHRNPREIKPASAAFLRDHYTTGPREAAAMAGYLASIGSDARAVQQRRPPTMGAGQSPTPAAEAKPTPAPGQPATTAATPVPSASIPNTPGAAPGPPGVEPGAKPGAVLATVRPRRPSDSIEVGALPAAAEAPAPRQSQPQEFEE